VVVVYFLTLATLTVLAHEAYRTTAFDLGSMDQAIWNTLHGRPFRATVQPDVEIRLVGHVEPILLPISLLYIIYSDPRSLLVLQSAIVALGALPAYWLARDLLGRPWLALAFPAAYLLYPPLQAANSFDFHPVTLAAPFLLFALNGLHGRRWVTFAVFAVLAMSCREDIPLAIVAMGFYAFFFIGRPSGEESVSESEGPSETGVRFMNPARWVGLAAVVTGAIWWYLALFVIPGWFGPGGQHAQLGRYAELGDNWTEIAGTLLFRPGVVWELLRSGPRLSYVANLLAPMAFLPLAGLPILLIGLPTLAMNVLSNYAPMHTFDQFHYSAPLAPVVVAAGALGTAYVTRLASHRSPMLGKWAGIGLCAVILTSSLGYQRLYGYTPLAESFRMPAVTEHHRLAGRFEEQVPTDAIVSAQSRLLPHLSQRERIYMFPRVDDAQYVFVDVSGDSWPVHPNDLKRQVDDLLAEGFSIVDAADGYALLSGREEGTSRWPDGFYDFARTESLDPHYPMTIDFGDELRFLGLDVLSRQEMTYLRMYWRALRPLDRDLRIYPFFFDDETGEIIEDTTQRPLVAALWYPTSRWQGEEIVVVETLPWDVGENFGVGLGVVDGMEWSGPDRLKLRVLSSSLVVRRFEDDTWARLIGYHDGQPYIESRNFEPVTASRLVAASLDGGPILSGLDAESWQVVPGGELRLTLYWQARDPMDESHTVFVHLTDGEGNLISQSDSIPAQGEYPTSWWVPEEVVADLHSLRIPAEVPAGEYHLRAGMYDDAGRRLVARDGDGVRFAGDAISSGKIEVVVP
jgi:uncharacterized membrane protein